MKKAAAILVTALAVILLAVFCRAENGGTEYTLSDDGTYYILSKYGGNEPEVKIEKRYNGLPVAAIAKDAFSGNISTYKIVIPDSIENIEPGAFSAMPSLHEFEAEGNYTAQNGALYTKDGKTLVRYPQAAEGEFTVPDGAAIGAHAFSGSKLSYVDARGAVSVGEYAFYRSDVSAIDFSDRLSAVSAHAFEYSSLYSVVIPGAATVSQYAFSRCEYLVYAELRNAKLDGEGVFYGDTSLVAVGFPDNATTVPALTFAGCTSLVSAPTGKNTKSLGDRAFYGCTALQYAPGGMTKGSETFGLCDGLTEQSGGRSAISGAPSLIEIKPAQTYGLKLTASGGYDIMTDTHLLSVNGSAITALFEGETVIYAVSRRGGDCAAITVRISDGEGLLESDHPYRPTMKIYSYTVPGSPSRIAVTFSSSDMLTGDDYIKVTDKNGKVYGTFTGSGLSGKTFFIDGDTVKVKMNAPAGGSYGFRIVAASPVSSYQPVVSITAPQAVTLQSGGEYDLDAKAVPDAAFPSELVYISCDTSVAAVSPDGKVRAVSAGQTEILICSPYYGVSASCAVTVTGKADFEYEISGAFASVKRYNGKGSVCTIPKSVDGRAVNRINAGAFSYGSVTAVNVGDGVTVISDKAFDGCLSLKEINVGENNASFSSKDGALYSKDGKTLLRVPCGITGTISVPDTVETIADGAFAYCVKLERVVIGRAVSSVSARAFAYCASLRQIAADNGSFIAVDGVLYTADKKELIYFPAGKNVHTFTVPAGTESISAGAFDGAGLTGIVIPPSVVRIDGQAFAKAYGLTSFTVNGGSAVYTVTDGCLYENGDLKAVPKSLTGTFTVPSSVRKILPYAFYGCAYIENVVFGTRVTEIGDHAFDGCRSINRLYLPQSVKTVGSGCFENCGTVYVYIPDGASVTDIADCCTVMCGKDAPAYLYCRQNGIKYEFCYYSEYGLYSIYSPVRADLRVTEDKDATLISGLTTVASQSVKAFSVDMQNGGLTLPAGEYILFREKTSSDRYYYEDGALEVITESSYSRFRRYHEYIVELAGDVIKPSLSVRSLPHKTHYSEYDTLDTDGLQLYYTDGHGITSVITEGYDAGCDLTTPGTKTVNVSCMGLSTGFTVTVSYSSISGELILSGEARYGSTVFADASGIVPSDAELIYVWRADGVIIQGAVSDSYTIRAEDVGKTLTAAVSNADDPSYEIVSGGVTALKAKTEMPPEPVVEKCEGTTVTLVSVPGCEYRLSDGSYSSDNVFSGLTAGKTYVFYQRYKETETNEASAGTGVSFTVPDYRIKTDKYFLNTANGTVSLIEPGTRVGAFLDGFENREMLSVYKDGKKLSEDGLVGTGCEIRMYNGGDLTDKYTAAITGDVNGDGKTTITDYLQIKERILSGEKLAREKEYAADVNGDGKITITDYLRLKYCIQNRVSPEQNRY